MDFFYCFIFRISDLPFYFSSFPPFLRLQAQIKILNLMDKKEKTALALKKKKSTLKEMETQAQKVGKDLSFNFLGFRFFPVQFPVLFLFSRSFITWMMLTFTK